MFESKEAKAFGALRYMLVEVMGEEMGLWSLYNAVRPNLGPLADNIDFGDVEDMEEAEVAAAVELRTEYYTQNPDMKLVEDNVALMQGMITHIMRSLWFNRTSKSISFGQSYGAIECILYESLLTETLFTADEGNETDQLCTQMNADNFDLTIRS